MEDHITEQELEERLSLIEKMISEGRRNTESWGWTFVLWGVVYYAAIGWSESGHNVWAWPATIMIGVILTFAGAFLTTGNHPGTTLGRAIGSIWIAVGISLFLLLFSLGASERLNDPHLFAAVISAILGLANGASALILRWKVQLACAVAWWVAAVATCFGSETQSRIVFLAAIFLCQIVFGIYGMIAEARQREQPGSANA